VANEKNHEFDLLILATGFQATQFMYPIKIYGAGGKPIDDVWSKGASAYLGMTVPSMPNFGMLYGPNTNLGHNSVILMIEAQSLYINALIRKVKDARKAGGAVSIEPKESVNKEYNDELQVRLANSAFADPNCHSWYKNEAGLITNNWAEAVVPYQKKTQSIDWNNFKIDGPGADAIKKEGKTSWPRVVEETQIPNVVVLAGLITTAGAVTTGLLYRKALQASLFHK
jgi:hypothetical protein